MTSQNPKNKHAKRRWNLWTADNHCYYCNRELTWEESTLEHLNSRVLRDKRPIAQGITTVLSCGPCNQHQAKTEMLSMPKSYWWKKSRQFPNWRKRGLTLKERAFVVWWGKIFGMHTDNRIE